MMKAFLLCLLCGALMLSGCVENKLCAAEGEQFSGALDCCQGLVKAVSTCEKCIREGEALAFDGIPCCEGLEAVDGFCAKPGTPMACREEGETIPVIANPPECCEGLELISPKEEMILGIMGYCTAKCGNGACEEESESAYNCPQDCPGENLEAQAQEFCGGENVDSVLVCGGKVLVVSSLLGGGITYYSTGETGLLEEEASCPVVAPDAMSEECRRLSLELDCADAAQVCGSQ